MRRLMCIFVFIMLAGTAFADAPLYELPEDAELLNEQTAGPYCWLELRFDTGEEALMVTESATGKTVSLSTVIPAAVTADVPQERAGAEAAVLAVYPDALMITGEDADGGAKLLHVITPSMSGRIWVLGDIIISRELEYGDYIRGGMLTMDGAVAAMHMHRPEAEFRAMELDEDDGVWCYEGEAYVDGREYEFELNAVTGRLMEWERD